MIIPLYLPFPFFCYHAIYSASLLSLVYYVVIPFSSLLASLILLFPDFFCYFPLPISILLSISFSSLLPHWLYSPVSCYFPRVVHFSYFFSLHCFRLDSSRLFSFRSVPFLLSCLALPLFSPSYFLGYSSFIASPAHLSFLFLLLCLSCFCYHYYATFLLPLLLLFIALAAWLSFYFALCASFNLLVRLFVLFPSSFLLLLSSFVPLFYLFFHFLSLTFVTSFCLTPFVSFIILLSSCLYLIFLSYASFSSFISYFLPYCLL